MKPHTAQLFLALSLFVTHAAAQGGAGAGAIADGAGIITGVPAPGSTVDNPQIDLSLFRPTCIVDDDCESENCENGPNDINVQDIPGIFYCGPPQGEENCQAVAANPPTIAGVSIEFARADGICNNLVPGQEQFGAREELQLRRVNGVPLAIEPSESGSPNPVSPRTISDAIVDQISSIPNNFGASTLLVYLGQFIDHDITLIEFQPIVPNDPTTFDTLSGTPPLDPIVTFELSVEVEGSDPPLNPNALTAWVDLSMVYGSDRETQFNLRNPDNLAQLDFILRDGQQFLPRASVLASQGRPVITAMSIALPGLFAAGDIRTNEQIMLASFHTLFMREHNRLVTQIGNSQGLSCDIDALPAGTNMPTITSVEELLAQGPLGEQCELLYQLARRVNIAQFQRIVFVEYFDSWHNRDQQIGGPNSLPPYVYNETLTPAIDIQFSTATYRFGHTAVVNYVARKGPEPDDPVDSVFLGNAFFNPSGVVRDGGIDTLLNGAANQCHERRDNFVVSGIRNFLFGNIPNSGLSNMDLPTFNIERGRDHEINLYNDLRTFYNLEPRNTFLDIVTGPGEGGITIEQDCVADDLQALFGDVDNCPPFVCGLAEYAQFGELGELFFAAQDDQFTRIQNGDRFHYLNVGGPGEAAVLAAGFTIQQIEEVSMSDILSRNLFPGRSNVFDPAVFQADECCNSVGDEGPSPFGVCVRSPDNTRLFVLTQLSLCDTLDQLELLNFVAGTMNPLSFRSYNCECRPSLDQSNTAVFTIIVQNRPPAETPEQFIQALRTEMFTVNSLQESDENRFPRENISFTMLPDGRMEVMTTVSPTANTNLFPSAEETIGAMEFAVRTNALGSGAIMSNGNMDIQCMDCSPLPTAADLGAGGAGAQGGAGAGGEGTLLGQSTVVGGVILGVIGAVVLIVVGLGVRFYMKRQSSNQFTSGQESV